MACETKALARIARAAKTLPLFFLYASPCFGFDVSITLSDREGYLIAAAAGFVALVIGISLFIGRRRRERRENVKRVVRDEIRF